MATETKVIQMQFVEKGATQVTNGVKKMGTAATKTTSSFDGLSKTLLRFVGVAAIIASLKSATTAALGFSSAMAEVKTLLDDTSQFEKMEKSVRAIALQFGNAPVSEAKALYQIVSAGAQDAAEALDILTVSNKLSIAGVTDVAVAADALTTVMNAYGDSVGTATDVSDAFFVAVKAGKTTIPELAGNIGQVSGVGATLGVRLEEILAATAALTKGTLNTTRSLRGLRAVMTAIVKPTEEALEVAGLLGIDFSAAGLAAQGFTEFLNGVQVAAQGDAAVLSKLFGNVEGLIPILALGGAAAEDYAESLAAMGEKAGKTETALAIMADTAQFKLNRAMVAFGLKAEQIGNLLLVVLAPAAELVAENMDILTVAVIALTAALIALKGVAIVGFLKAIVIGIKAFTVALLGTPIGWFIASLAAITTAVVLLNRKFMILEPTWELIKTGFSLMINNIQIGLNSFLNWIDILFAKLKTKLDEFKIAYQEALVFVASKIGTEAGFENSITELERLKSEQLNYNETLKETIEGRITANQELAKENELLSENWEIAKGQLFTEREKQSVQTEGPDVPGRPGAESEAALNVALKEQEIRLKKVLELRARGKELILELRTPLEIYNAQMKELNELFKAQAIGIDTFNRAQKKYQEELKASNEQTELFGDLMEKAINGTLTAKDLFLVAVRQILRGLFDMNKEAQNTTDSFLQLGNSLGGGGGIGGSIGSIIGSIFGSFISPAPVAPTPSPSFSGFNQPNILAAKGIVMERGVQTFDKGSVFQTATTFPMANGRGLMSEAGPEAVMPLTRGRDGRLGVSTSGSSSSRVIINIVDQRSGGEQAQVRQSTDAQGNKKYDIFIKDSVNRTFGSGGFDKSMKQFGVGRGGNRS